jgi:hypothetical protein
MEGESEEPCVSFPLKELLGVEVRVELAIVMAAKGYPDEGYSSLLTGLGRAMELSDAGEPWGPDLVAQYRRTAFEFAERYGVARD